MLGWAGHMKTWHTFRNKLTPSSLFLQNYWQLVENRPLMMWRAKISMSTKCTVSFPGSLPYWHSESAHILHEPMSRLCWADANLLSHANICPEGFSFVRSGTTLLSSQHNWFHIGSWTLSLGLWIQNLQNNHASMEKTRKIHEHLETIYIIYEVTDFQTPRLYI